MSGDWEPEPAIALSRVAAEREDRARSEISALVARLREDADPGRALAALVALRRELDDVEAHQVDAALTAGWSWSRVGGVLGISKQAAHRKHSRRRLESAATGSTTTPSRRGASNGQPGDRRPRMTITGEARAAVQYARREALTLGARTVAPEHLLLGLRAVEHGIAGRALADSGIGAEALRAALGGPTTTRPAWREEVDGESASLLPITA